MVLNTEFFIRLIKLNRMEGSMEDIGMVLVAALAFYMMKIFVDWIDDFINKK